MLGSVVMLAATGAGVWLMRPVPLPVVKLARKDVTVSLKATGRILSGGAVSVGSALEGRVERLAVHPGQVVRPDELLFALDPGPLRNEIATLEETIRDLERECRALETHDAAPEYREARRALEVASRRLGRHRGSRTPAGRGLADPSSVNTLLRPSHDLRYMPAASEDDLWEYQQALQRFGEERERLQRQHADARERVRDARAQLTVLQARGASLQCLSPAAGLVTSLKVQPGETVAAGTPVLRIEDTRHLTVRALVDDPDHTAVRVGQPAWITVGKGGFAGKVVQVTPGVDGDLWQSWLTIQPASTPCVFRDGESVGVRVVTRRLRQALVLPRRAVRRWRTGSVVYVQQNGRVEECAVDAVAVDTGEVAILSGLKPEDLVTLPPRSGPPARQALARS